MVAAESAGKNGAELQAIEDAWNAQAGLKLFDEAVVDAAPGWLQFPQYTESAVLRARSMPVW